MAPLQILFVDDDPAIRLTLPVILNHHGYSVTTASSVREALSYMGAYDFRVLISDLNIGHPGDGFAVISAMRNTQPQCINFLLTGYPAFEAALQALRSHVDNYLVKPADIDALVAAIEESIAAPQTTGLYPLKQVSTIIRENAREIASHALKQIKADPELNVLAMSDEERIDHIPALLATITDQLESSKPGASLSPMVEAAAQHGRLRHRLGYTIPMIVEEVRLIEESISEAIQDHLISLDLSNVIPDLRRVNRFLEVQLKESLRAYLARDEKIKPDASSERTA